MEHKISANSVKVFLIALFLSGSSVISYSQIYPWNPVKNFTSGHIDKNPVFGTKQSDVISLFNWEFLAFERHLDSVSDICVLKIGPDGPVDSVIYITKGQSNKNPSVSYNSVPFYFNNQINNSLILWESHKNGRSDIYASYYNSSEGWQSPFPVDTSNSDKHKPRSVHLDSNVFAMVYEKDDDIIFKIIDAKTQTAINDTNLTTTENSFCRNAFIINLYNSIVVSYEKKKPDNKNSIEFRNYSVSTNWSVPDTVAFAGDNINNGFSIYFNDPINIFTSDRLGNKNIYGTALNSFEGLKPIIIDTTSENYDYESYLFPVITDGGFYNQANTYIKKSDSLRIIFSNEINQQDSLAIPDSSQELSLTMNRGIRVGTFDVISWVVFNKDSLSYSGLYGKSVRLIVLGINRISSEIPQSFKLYQNYPNPFNPVTRIRFDITASTGKSLSVVKLIIYDGLGRELEMPIDDQLSPGTYEVTWDASKYSSGVYFYKLISGDFISSKKLLLLK